MGRLVSLESRPSYDFCISVPISHLVITIALCMPIKHSVFNVKALVEAFSIFVKLQSSPLIRSHN